MDGKDPPVVRAIGREYVVAHNLVEDRREKSVGRLVHEGHEVPVLGGTGPGVGKECRVGNRRRMPAEQLVPRHTGSRSHELEVLAAYHTEVQYAGHKDDNQWVEVADTLGEEAQQVELAGKQGEAQQVELADK